MKRPKAMLASGGVPRVDGDLADLIEYGQSSATVDFMDVLTRALAACPLEETEIGRFIRAKLSQDERRSAEEVDEIVRQVDMVAKAYHLQAAVFALKSEPKGTPRAQAVPTRARKSSK